MKKTVLVFAMLSGLVSCSGPSTGEQEKGAAGAPVVQEQAIAEDSIGFGKFTHVEVSPSLDAKMAASGKKIYDLKCASCHRLNNEKLVGPGWKEVTVRRKAEWIMNFVTNVDEMLNKDANAQAMLEVCLVRMPNQNISDEEARSVYEFMRQNDGVK